jgi:hypothetical protein
MPETITLTKRFEGRSVTKLQGSELNVYYVLSTWNPYVVVLMKSACVSSNRHVQPCIIILNNKRSSL